MVDISERSASLDVNLCATIGRLYSNYMLSSENYYMVALAGFEPAHMRVKDARVNTASP